MQVSRRTKFSLAQLLSVVERPIVHVIFDKFGFATQSVYSPADISEELNSAEESVLSDLLVEIIQINRTLRSQTSPRYKFDDQYSIVRKSLLLDGYLVGENSIQALDPNFSGHEPVEDALLKELDDSDLQKKEDIKASADDFVKAQPDYNGSLTNIRIALETLVREIALEKGFSTTKSGNTWGPSLGHLKVAVL
jgi:hypothetical protein